MLNICKKHKTKPALVYGQCIGCELDGLRKENEGLKSALRVLHSWASFDIGESACQALIPEDVVRLCDKALERGVQTGNLPTKHKKGENV